MAAPGLIDPTKPGKYPVILSDALLGKPSNEAYTGVRYNHRPTLSSDTAPATARLKKSARDESYNLGFDDQGNRYQYNGIRTTDDGNYVLIFDPARKAFVLHRLDSTFHMNLTRTPTESNAETLRKQFPHLEVRTANSAAKQQNGKGTEKTEAGKTAAAAAKDARASAGSTPRAQGGNKPEKSAAVALSLPDVNAAPAKSTSSTPSKQKQQQKQPEKTAEPPAAPPEPEKKTKRRAPSPVESEEEDDDDDDGGLTVEYPGGNPDAFQQAGRFTPAFPVAVTRRFSEFARDIVNEEDEEEAMGNGFHDRPYGETWADEAGYEEEDDEDDDEEEEEEEERGDEQPIPQKPQSPAENPAAVEPDRYTFDEGDDDEDHNDALEQDFGDLEAELEREFDKVQNEGHQSDSSVSEEE